MNKAIILGLGVLFSATAMAQQYKWVDQNGKVQYGDVPPPGVKAQRLKPPAGGSAPAPSAAAKKAEKPLSAEEAFRIGIDGRPRNGHGPVTPAGEKAACAGQAEFRA